MSHDSRKIRFGFGMTSEIRPSGANPDSFVSLNHFRRDRVQVGLPSEFQPAEGET